MTTALMADISEVVLVPNAFLLLGNVHVER